MVSQVETPNGKRWAIVFDNDCTGLEDICEMQKGLIEIMITATSSEAYDISKVGFYETLNLLNECLLNQTQCFEYERFLKGQK